MSQILLACVMSLGAVTDAAPEPKESNEPSFFSQIKSLADFGGLKSFFSRVDSLLPGRMQRVPYPTPHYLEHVPQYFPPDPAFPLQRERDSMLDPTGELRRDTANPIAPPIAPVPATAPVGR